MADSPASSLSSILSDDIPDDPKLDENEHASMTPNMPASKRRRIGNSSWDRHTPVSSIHDEVMPGSPTSTISSDTSGDVPNTPTTGLGSSIILEEDFGPGNEQVTVCKWDGCDAGDLGNMDDLVKHIHDDHIMPRQKKYSCEWSDCSRKGMSHASGYALRAHMRSHTREKPFYCALPGEFGALVSCFSFSRRNLVRGVFSGPKMSRPRPLVPLWRCTHKSRRSSNAAPSNYLEKLPSQEQC